MDTDERYVVQQIVNRALDKGYLLSVYDGEEYAIKDSTDAEEVMGQLGHCDAEWLGVWTPTGERRIGTIMLVYGNDADEVVADWTDNTEILEIVG